MKLINVCALVCILFSTSAWSQDEGSDSSNLVLYLDSSTFEMPGGFFIQEGLYYFDENDKGQRVPKSREAVYVQQFPAVYLALPFKNGGYCKMTQVWAYSDDYILSCRSSINGGWVYINVYDMNFKLVESNLKFEKEEGGTNKQAKLKAANAKVQTILKKYFTCDELYAAIDANITEMIDVQADVAPFACSEGATLPIEKLRKADLKK